MRAFRLLPLLLLPALLALTAGPAPAAPPPGWHYTVTLDEDLTQAEVRLRFRGFLPKRLVHARPAGLPALEPIAPPGVAALDVHDEGRSFVPRGLPRGGTVAWRVDLTRLEEIRDGRQALARRVGADLLVLPGALFLRPALWPRRMRVVVAFALPAGRRAAVPWPPDAEGWRVDPEALRLQSQIALGRMPENRLEVAGATFDVAVLDAPHRADREGIRTWLATAAGAVAQLHGRFPARRVLALVHPVPSRRPAEVFGSAMRGGGAHVRLLIAAAAPAAELVGGWVAVHELTHLGMPWTPDGEAWLQEGFVTYYQEVLRARAGIHTEREAWQELVSGFGRGRRSGGSRTLQHESEVMHRHHTYHRVYWAGAAMALLLDVALRRRFPETWSLDRAVRLWHGQHGGTKGGAASGLDLMADVDRRLGRPVCVPIARRLLAMTTFPDLGDVLDDLGVRVEGGRVELDDEAPLARVRKAIMAPIGRASSGR